ncbi:MAG: GHKL domain-containing protein [Planctomycetales bacterium]|nr:GHKL domain-containing protein [Planctomycetales bacterium]
MAATIFVTGRVALLIAITPGDATPIFPPAGIALAGLLLYGNPLAPGVFLGSLLINLSLGLSYSALGIAAGSTAQALLGAWLIRRFVGFPNPLTQESSAQMFLILGGPVACLLAATVGTASLEWSGQLDPAERVFNWLNWWVGDSLGVLIFTPLILLLLAKPRSAWRPRILSLSGPLLLICAAAVGVFVYASYREQRNLETEFQRQIVTRVETVKRQLDSYLNVLRSIGSLYASSQEVERDEFQSFVRGALQQYPKIQALEWAPRVPAEERNRFCAMARRDAEMAKEQDPALASALEKFEFTQRVKKEGESTAQMAPDVARDYYYPVYYLEPFERNEEALGYNLGSDAKRLAALETARDTGDMVATSRIRLVQDPSGYSCLAILPIYQNEQPTATVEERRRHLQGYVLGVFRITEAVAHVLAELPLIGIDLRLLDVSAPPGEQLLYERLYQDQLRPGSNVLDNQPPIDIDFADRQWSVDFQATPSFVADQRPWQAWAMPVVVMLFVGLAVVFLLGATGRAIEIQQVVDQRTAELQEANAQLRHSNQDLEQFAYVASHDLQEPLRAVAGFCSLLKNKYEGALDERGKKYVDFAVDGAHRMQKLLLGLLEYSRVNTRPVHRLRADCNQLLSEALENLRVPMTDSGAVVAHDPLPTIRADPTQIVQLLQNLVGNAIKYCDQDPPRIQVAAQRHAQDWTFSVSDNGIGINPDQCERVFVIFQRLHTREAYEGTGIGLAICKRIVERHHGRMWVDSTPGEGSTFFFTIPDEGTP